MTNEQKKYISYLERNCLNGKYNSIEEANKQKILREYGKGLKLSEIKMDQAVAEYALAQK